MDEETDSKSGRRKRRGRLPRNKQRERILRMVREQESVVDAVGLAARTGLHVTTVRFHLDALCEEGMITRTRLSRAGAGRPRMGYLAFEERMDYQMLAEVLAMELGETVPIRATRAQHAGRLWADRMTTAPPQVGATVGADAGAEAESGDALDQAARLATEVFERMGFDPELDTVSHATTSLRTDNQQVLGRERVIRLRACPIRDLARAHREVGCGVHLGLLQGLLAGAAGTVDRTEQSLPAMSAQLEPFVEPELCLARLVART